MDVGTILIIGTLVIAYLYLYLAGRYYRREGFLAGSPLNGADLIRPITGKPINTGDLRKPCKTGVIMEQRIESPYVKRSILDVDDYEYNLVFQQEGDREISHALYNKLQSQYPLDWSVQPPSSAHFQAGLQRLKESFENAPAEPVTLDPYKEISGASLTPPDTSLIEMEERKILQTYKPERTDNLTKYNPEDAKELIRKVYNAKGLIPTVLQKDTNIYEVVGTRRKDEKIVYEDEEAPVSKAPVAAAGEATITIPATAVDVAAGLDPYYSPSPSTHIGRWDYQKFTPGLERMFAPTYPTTEWY